MNAKAPPSLRMLQRWFAAETAERGDTLTGTALARSRRVERLLTRGPQLSAVERLQIYRDGYFARLVEALADDYPALCHALGAATFEELAHDYIERRPSRSFSLNAYGRGMAEFCEGRAEPWAQFAVDLARLEWALVEVVHEAAAEGLTLPALANVPADELQKSRLVPNPALRVLAFDHPVNAFLQAFRDDAEPTRPEPSPSAVAVYRRGLLLWRMPLELRAARLLQDLVAGASLEAAVAALEQREESPSARVELAERLPQWLGTWIREGFFVGLE